MQGILLGVLFLYVLDAGLPRAHLFSRVENIIGLEFFLVPVERDIIIDVVLELLIFAFSLFLFGLSLDFGDKMPE